MITSSSPFYITGGTLPPDASSYVERQADRDLLVALQDGEYCYVLNSRQMGKSSLCVRTMGRLREQGVRTAFLDLTKFGGRNLTAEQWYAALLAELGRELGLRAECLQYWKEHPELPPVQRLFGAIAEVALGTGVQVFRSSGVQEGPDPTPQGRAASAPEDLNTRTPEHPCPLVVFIDEIDVTRSLPFNTDEFFAAIRQCYVGRATEPVLQQVTFCLLGTATPAELIEDTRISPFNIGRRIEVRDFTPEEAAPLARGLVQAGGTPTEGPDVINKDAQDRQDGGKEGQRLLERILYWTGGHPYLTQRLCRAVAEAQSVTPSPPPASRVPGPFTPSAAVDRLCAALFLTHTAKEGDDNLALVRNRLLKSEADLASLLELYGKLRAGKEVADDETNALCGVLKLSGVAKVETGRLRVRNRIYGEVFDREWVQQHMPDAEVRRQREAYRRGLLRAAAVAAVIVAVVAGLALTAVNQARVADRQRHAAQEAQKTLRRTLYVAQMNVAQQAWSAGNVQQALKLLDAQRPGPGQEELRGFEWRYLWRLTRQRSPVLRLQVTAAAFSPDGKFLAIVTPDGTVKLSDRASGRTAATLTRLANPGFRAVRFLDATTLITLGWNRSSTVTVTVTLWDVVKRRPMASHNWSEAVPPGISSSSDGKILLVTVKNAIKLWDVVAWRELGSLPSRKEWRSPAPSPDHRTLAVGSLAGPVELWDIRTQRQVATLKGHIGFIGAVAFSPDGKTLATGSDDATVKLWDVATQQEVATLRGHPAAISSLAFSKDGSTLATGGLDSLVKLWDVATKQELATLRGHRQGISWLEFSSDDSTLATGSAADRTVMLWDVGRQDADVLAGDVARMAFSPDSKILAASARGGPLRLWDVATSREVANLARGEHDTLSPFAFSPQTVAFSPDGKPLEVTASGDTVTVWQGATPRAANRREFKSQAGITHIALSPDRKTLAIASHAPERGGEVRLWEVAARQVVATFRGNPAMSSASALAFSPDSKILAAALGSPNVPGPGTVELWDVVARRRLDTARGDGDSDYVHCMAFSPDGKLLATTDSGRRIVKLWNVANGRLELTTTLEGPAGVVVVVAFSPDGKRLATAGHNLTVTLWDMETKQEVTTLKGHRAPIWSLAFSPDGSTLASGATDHTVRLWRAPPLAEIDAQAGETAR